jgi:hypothetical protein
VQFEAAEEGSLLEVQIAPIVGGDFAGDQAVKSIADARDGNLLRSRRHRCVTDRDRGGEGDGESGKYGMKRTGGHVNLHSAAIRAR